MYSWLMGTVLVFMYVYMLLNPFVFHFCNIFVPKDLKAEASLEEPCKHIKGMAACNCTIIHYFPMEMAIKIRNRMIGDGDSVIAILRISRIHL